MGGQVTRRRTRRAQAIVLVLVAAAVTPALALSSASAVVATPRTYFAGTPQSAPGTAWQLTVLNESASTQTISQPALHTVAAGSETVFSGSCPASPPSPCAEPMIFNASSPDLLAFAEAAIENPDASQTALFLPPTAFELLGPNGTEVSELDALATNTPPVLTLLQTGQTTLTGLVNPLGGQLGTVQSSLTALGGQVGGVSSSLSSVSGQVGSASTTAAGAAQVTALATQVTSLNAKVSRLSTEITGLTKELKPKKSTKGKPKKHR
jgi:outer membrane murein-binding lipoprotein Lpp